MTAAFRFSVLFSTRFTALLPFLSFSQAGVEGSVCERVPLLVIPGNAVCDVGISWFRCHHEALCAVVIPVCVLHYGIATSLRDTPRNDRLSAFPTISLSPHEISSAIQYPEGRQGIPERMTETQEQNKQYEGMSGRGRSRLCAEEHGEARS